MHGAAGRGRDAVGVRTIEGEIAGGGIVRSVAKKADPAAAAKDWHHHFTAGGGTAGHSEHSGAAASLGECADLFGAGAGGLGAGRGDGWASILPSGAAASRLAPRRRGR